MTSSFSFPPPPPPPPKAPASVYEGAAVSHSQNDAQYSRGGRGGKANHRGRGRGNSQLGQRGGSYGRGGYSDGGARFAAQTPMTGVSGPQQYLPQLPTDSNRGYMMPQYPQWQPTPAPAPFQYSSSQYPYSQFTAAPIPYPSHNLQNQFNRPGRPLNGYNVQLPGFNADGYMPQSWPLPVAQLNHAQQAMGPPIRMGFDADHPQNVGRDVYKTRGHFSSPRANAPNQHAGNKRRHEDKDVNQISVNGQKRPKTQVAPIVPNFGPQLPNIPAPAGVASVMPNKGQSKSKRNKKKRNFNQLGLTPRTEEHEDSEPEDVDEEAAFVDHGQTLQFEYRGRTATLGSSSDIAAWIEQRRQRWPTKERVDEKLQAAAQRAQEQQELRRKAHESQRKERQQERKQKTQKNDVEQRRKSLQKHLKKAERLRRELEKSEKKAAAIAANGRTEDIESSDSVSISSSSSQPSSDSEHSTDDDVPEEASSKGKGPITVPPPERKSRRICKYFLTKGRCRLGARCSFRHELPERGNEQSKREKQEKKVEQQKPKRVSLHARLVEQEQCAENELALQAVKHFGRSGFFEHIPEDEPVGLRILANKKRAVDSPADSFAYIDAIQLFNDAVTEGISQLKQEAPTTPENPDPAPLQQQEEPNGSPAMLDSELYARQEVDCVHEQELIGPMSESSSYALEEHTKGTTLPADGSLRANGSQESQQTERKEKTASGPDDKLYTGQDQLESAMASKGTQLHNEQPPQAQDFAIADRTQGVVDLVHGPLAAPDSCGAQ